MGRRFVLFAQANSETTSVLMTGPGMENGRAFKAGGCPSSTENQLCDLEPVTTPL